MTGSAGRPDGRDRAWVRPQSWLLPAGIAALCALVGLSRVPFLTAPLSSDEGGFLVVGAQWDAGRSLYGSYWVDRPPLLITVFAVADALGGAVALRVIGVLVAMAAVSAAGVLGWLASGRRPAGAIASACTAAAFLATPLFGTRIVDGELLASPLILAGLAALLASYEPVTDRRAAALRVAAGALGAGAFLVKQNMVDVFVVAAVLAGHMLWRSGLRRAGGPALPVVAGAVVTTAAVTTLATTRGTSVPGLWEAVVVFRFAAAGLLSFSGARLAGLVHAYVVSGALVVTLVAGAACVARRTPATGPQPPALGTAAFALIGWEVVGVVAGGSYWSHYLVGLVPGMVLLVAVALRAPGTVSRRLLTVTLVYAVAASAVSWSLHPAAPSAPNGDQLAASYVRHHARPGDTIVVAFGHADVVKDSGLGSPYPYMWTLPAFVRDPQLTGLDRLLRSPSAPRWFVADGDLSHWGHPGVVLQQIVDSHYTVARRATKWIVLRRDPATTRLPHVAGTALSRRRQRPPPGPPEALRPDAARASGTKHVRWT